MDEKVKLLLDIKEELNEAELLIKENKDLDSLKKKAVENNKAILFYLCIDALSLTERDLYDSDELVLYEYGMKSLGKFEELNNWRYDEFKSRARELVTRLSLKGLSIREYSAMDEKIALLNEFFPENPVGPKTSPKAINEKFISVLNHEK